MASYHVNDTPLKLNKNDTCLNKMQVQSRCFLVFCILRWFVYLKNSLFIIFISENFSTLFQITPLSLFPYFSLRFIYCENDGCREDERNTFYFFLVYLSFEAASTFPIFLKGRNYRLRSFVNGSTSWSVIRKCL